MDPQQWISLWYEIEEIEISELQVINMISISTSTEKNKKFLKTFPWSAFLVMSCITLYL